MAVLTLPRRTVARRPRKRRAGLVVALPGAEKPEDALKRLHVMLAARRRPESIVLFAVDRHGAIEGYEFGVSKRSYLALMSGILMDRAVNCGDEE